MQLLVIVVVGEAIALFVLFCEIFIKMLNDFKTKNVQVLTSAYTIYW